MVPVILDGDPGHDDAIAWLLAAASDALDIRAITSVAGNAPLARTTANMQQIASLYGLFDVPLAEGESRPLVREPMAAPSVHGESGLDGPTLPPPTIDLDASGGVDLMAQILRESPEPVTIVATGPLTNVATLLLSYPELKPKIAQISIMGGGMLSGNWTPAAEFNILVDPEAAKVVFESAVPLIVAPLDVTEKAYVLPSDAERVRTIGGPLAEIVADWLDFFYKFHADLGYPGGPVHDPVAVVALTHPEFLTMRDIYVQVETSGDYCTGATIGDFFCATGHPPNAKVILGIDRAAYVDLIGEAVAQLSGRPNGNAHSRHPAACASRSAGSTAAKPPEDGFCAAASGPQNDSGAAAVTLSNGEAPSPSFCGSAQRLALANAAPAPPRAQNQHRVIIDCDPGTDDVAALILAKNAANLDVLAVTTVAGNVPLDDGTRNALNTLEFLDWDIPVAEGAAKPLVEELVTARDIHGSDGLLGIELPQSKREVIADPAWELIYRLACEHPGDLELITLGPLTNIAIALIKHPDLVGKIKRIVSMGGAILAGNTVTNPGNAAAEFNFVVDPEAAEKVLQSGIPVYLCPLDVTHQAYLTREELAEIAAIGTPQAELFAELFIRNYDLLAAYSDGNGTPLHDPTAVMYAIDDSYFTAKHCFLGVETSGSISRGKVVTDAYSDKQFEANNYLVQIVDRTEFVSRIKELLTPRHPAAQLRKRERV